MTLHGYLYICLVIRIFCLLTVESIDRTEYLASKRPCDLTQKIAVWYERGLRQEEIIYHYVKINKNIPANSVVRALFDADVNVFLEGKDKWTSAYVPAGDWMEVRSSETRSDLSFVVKRTAPGFVKLTSLTIDGMEQCDTYKQSLPRGGNLTDSQCGRRITNPNGATDVISGLYLPQDTGSVADGPASNGHWPWHVAIYLLPPIANPIKTKVFSCGGTLVSSTFVLTAAHCIGGRAADRIAVRFGVYDLESGYGNSYTIPNVANVFVPKSYNKTHYLNDIALLKLTSEVQFTDFIRPACLWHRRRSNPTDNRGILVGWGYTDTNQYSQQLQQVKLPLVSDGTCIRSNPITGSRFALGHYICVGFFNKGTSPCKGDDGGAFQVFVPDAINDGGEAMSGAWYVRGVLSFFVDQEGEPLTNCVNSDSYTVFTDVDKNAEWIDSYVK